jgi:tetratricopeptide (TPR) repeat protein
MRRVWGLISLLIAPAVMVGCSGREKPIIHPGEITSRQQQSHLRKRVTSLLEKRSYHRAIELMRSRKQPGTPVAGMGREYIMAINGLIADGEESFSRGNYANAGNSFKWALEAYPSVPSLRERVRQDPKYLKNQMEICSSRLMEQGLMEYRRGNLENAIRKWKEVVTFDPGHMEAKKAIETATDQLRALQEMEKLHQ